MNVYSSNEAWVKTGSLLTTDPSTGLPVGEPANVRNYFVASSNHGNGSPPTTAPTTCMNFPSTVDPNPLLRALWVALERWVTAGTAPPPSANPSVTDRTAVFIPTGAKINELGIGFVPRADVGYPGLPNSIDTFSGLVSVRNVWSFGPRFDQGVLDTVPAAPTGAFYKASVPVVDANGNDASGIILPELVALLGSNFGWNVRSPKYGGSADFSDGCESAGSFVPFALTEASKLPGDSRPSLETLYGNKSTWVARRAAAAQAQLSEQLAAVGGVALAQLRIEQARLAVLSGKPAEAERFLRQAEEAAQVSRWPLRTPGEADYAWGIIAMGRSEFMLAVARLGEALKAAQASGDAVLEARALGELFQAHPKTGEKILFVNEAYTSHICSVSRQESDALLRLLLETMKSPECQARVRWSTGTLAIWDNYLTQHYAVADYPKSERVVQR
jgi:hypothetical protein